MVAAKDVTFTVSNLAVSKLRPYQPEAHSLALAVT